MDSLRKHHPDLVMVDGGDVGVSNRKNHAWRTPLLLDAMREMGYDAVLLGERDVAEPVLKWARAANGSGMRVLSGNLHASGLPPVGHTIISRGGVRLGVVAAFPNRIGTYIKDGRLDPLHAYLDQAKKQLDAEQVDYRVLVLHGTTVDGKTIGGARAEFDAILVGHSSGAEMPLTLQEGKAPLVGPGDRGREIALLRFSTKNGKAAVDAQILALGDHVADSEKAAPFIQKAQDMARERMKAYNRKPARTSSSSQLR